MTGNIGAEYDLSARDRSSIVRRILGNFAIVFGGSSLAAVLGLIALGFNARALGTEGIGTLAVITATAAIVTRVFAFQSWVPLIKLGAEALKANDKERIADLTRVGLALDFAAAIVGMIFAVLLVLWAGGRVGIPAQMIVPAGIYMLSVATGVTDTASGLLRLLNRFAIVTSVHLAAAGLGCLYAALLYFVQADLAAYVLGYAAITATANIALQLAGLRVARRAGVPIGVRGTREAWRRTGREMWSSSLLTSLSGTIYVLRDNAPHLIIGAFLGTSAVGLYHVASRIAGILSMVLSALNQSLYPEAARLAASRSYSELNWFVLQTSGLCGAVGAMAVLGVIVAGKLALLMLGGNDYLDAYWVLVILTAANGLSLAGVGVRAAVLAVTGPIATLLMTACAFAAFAFTFPFVLRELGIFGAALAQVVFDGISLGIASLQHRLCQTRSRSSH